MEASPGDNLERVLAEFAQRYDAATRAEQQMRALSVTAASRDGVVEATVSVDGWTSAVRFLGNRFKEMSGPELADSVMAALTTARAEAATRVATILLSAEAQIPGRAAPFSDGDQVLRSSGSRAQPHTCWHRVVREARAVTDRHVAVMDQAAVQRPSHASGQSGRGEGEGTDADFPGGSLGTARPGSQGPLWGREHPARPSSPPAGELPPELRNAAVALRDAVCDAAEGVCASCRRRRPNARERSNTAQPAVDIA
ncbi:YbaB/EbfC family nucleoid-associated protein [Streptomyces sp. NPDC001792]|uniref:YbaB/EbfC family nucleoid-associated protein n=1 Tax=Streptomyces sp. NPDC001792 TaxID=3154524 RepID=UPI00332F51BC